jgi:alpha-L-fucosidase
LHHGAGCSLKINGEAIYGTWPWRIYGKGCTKVAADTFHDTETATYTAEDFRFTTEGSIPYAIEPAKPSGNEAVIRALGANAMQSPKVESVTFLGAEDKRVFGNRGGSANLTAAQAPGKYEYMYRIVSAPYAQ